jgi:hypothetical protein
LFFSSFHNPRSHITRTTLTSASKNRPHLPSWAELLTPIPRPTHTDCPFCLSLSRQCRAPALAYLLALRITPPLHSFSIPFLSPAIYLFHRLLSLLYINTTTVTTKIICSASSSRRDHPAQLTGLPTARLVVS